jgi:hypothetical protein
VYSATQEWVAILTPGEDERRFTVLSVMDEPVEHRARPSVPKCPMPYRTACLKKKTRPSHT